MYLFKKPTKEFRVVENVEDRDDPYIKRFKVERKFIVGLFSKREEWFPLFCKTSCGWYKKSFVSEAEANEEIDIWISGERPPENQNKFE